MTLFQKWIVVLGILFIIAVSMKSTIKIEHSGMVEIIGGLHVSGDVDSQVTHLGLDF